VIQNRVKERDLNQTIIGVDGTLTRDELNKDLNPANNQPTKNRDK
jgi:hypothetical protein